MDLWLLFGIGIVAGFIDSIAGGGGLITIPALSLILGSGPLAIGTNKLAAAIGTCISFSIYWKGGHVRWGNALRFAGIVGLSSFVGSYTSPLLPKFLFPWLLVLTCPIVLYVIWKKELWIQKKAPDSIYWGAFILSGVLCGFYDGLWGPGGGTFMFLSLTLWAHLPLLEALAASKLANFLSASASLGGYGSQGLVDISTGLWLAGGMLIGSFVGAQLATKNAARVVRPILLVVVVLLLVRVLQDLNSL